MKIIVKHDPSSKFSARSSSHVDIRNRPSKSLSFKRHTSPISHTPIRIGEMEINNLLLAQRSDILAKFISMMSSSEDNRQFLIEQLLMNPISNKIPSIQLKKINNYNRDIFDTINKSLGFRMIEKEVDIID